MHFPRLQSLQCRHNPNGCPLGNGPSPTTLNTWHHIVIVNDNGAGSAYMNGVLTGTASGLATNHDSTHNHGSVGSSTAYSGALDGYVDELSLYTRALSLTDVQALYNGGNGPSDIASLNPTHWWRMGDSESLTSSTTIKDIAGSSDGTLQNGATIATITP